MMTKRSNHMPTLTSSVMMKTTTNDSPDPRRPQQLRNHDVAAHHDPVGPAHRPEEARLMKANCSKELPEYQAVNNSVE